jgi:hypothetical protein
MGLETIVNKHLKYTYDNGWRYEFWLKSEKRIVYGEYSMSMSPLIAPSSFSLRGSKEGDSGTRRRRGEVDARGRRRT